MGRTPDERGLGPTSPPPIGRLIPSGCGCRSLADPRPLEEPQRASIPRQPAKDMTSNLVITVDRPAALFPLKGAVRRDTHQIDG